MHRLSNINLIRAAVLLVTAVATTPRAFAEMWQDPSVPMTDARAPHSFQLHAVRAEVDEVVLGLQEEPKGFGLASSDVLLKKYGVTVQEVVRELAPHLETATAVLQHVEAYGENVHEYWDFTFQGLKLHKMYVRMHFNRNQLVMLRAAFPAYRLSASEVEQFEFTPPKDLGFDFDKEREQRFEEKVLANAGGMLAPAWLLRTKNLQTEQISELLIEAQNGAVLESNTDRTLPLLQTARVFAKGPGDGQIIETTLPDLTGTGHLDGRYFKVYAPDDHSSRVEANGSLLAFDPNQEKDNVSFDQVQAYYTASRGIEWFTKTLSLAHPPAPIPVRVNALVRGSPANALFVPPPFGPEIKVGRGNDSIRNLARETDVILHELAHHIIYQHITSDTGEAGILHEGIADYFAYVINGDPYLGETVEVGQPYLRTAMLPENERFDLLDPKKGKHKAGEIWSALLWQIHGDLKEKLGKGAEKIVYGALPYIGPGGGFKDALLALLNADRDQNPLSPENPEFGIYGQSKCTILAAAVNRGFATFIENLDASSCNLNLSDLAQESRDLHEEAYGIRTHGNGTSVELFGRKCSTVPLPGALPVGPILLLMPLLFAIVREKNVRRKKV